MPYATGAGSRNGKRRAASGRERATKPSVVITELPYQTNKAGFVAAVADLVNEQKLTGGWGPHAPVPPCLGFCIVLWPCFVQAGFVLKLTATVLLWYHVNKSPRSLCPCTMPISACLGLGRTLPAR